MTNETTGARLTDYTVLAGKQVVGGRAQQIWLVLADESRIAVCYEAAEAEQVRAALASASGWNASVMAYRAETAETMAVEAENRRLEAENGLAQRKVDPLDTDAGRRAIARLAAIPQVGEYARAFVALRDEVSSMAYDQLLRLCLSGLDYHAYYSTTHLRVWAGNVRLTPQHWQGVYDFAAAWPGGAQAFPWDCDGAERAERKADGR